MQTPGDSPEKSSWPYGSLLLFGFFGAGTPSGRRLAWRTTGALALAAAAMAGLTVADEPVLRLLCAVALPTAVALIGWAYQQYLHSLDELSRLLQLRAFAFAYGATMVLLFTSFAYTVAMRQPGLSVVGTTILVILAEPARGAMLAYLARKYQ